MAAEPTEAKPPVAGAVTVKDALGSAPIIYFDGAPNYGSNAGVISLTLAMARYLATDDGGVATDIIATAHLRCSVQGALALRKAIDDALLLAAPAADGGRSN
jgi:hypothetical protein